MTVDSEDCVFQYASFHVLSFAIFSILRYLNYSLPFV